MSHSAFLLTSGTAPVSALPLLASAGDTALYGVGATSSVSTADGARWFVFGSAEGVRDARGTLQPFSVDALAAAGALPAEAVEGRIVVVRFGADGAAGVALDAFARSDVFFGSTSSGAFATSDASLVPDAARGSIDQAALAHALTVYGTRPPKRHTLWSGVRRLGPGETAVLAGRRVSVATLPFVAEPALADADVKLDDYADALLEAVRARASLDGNVVYLSSGWDSTSLLACLVHLFGPGKVRAVIGRMVYAERSGVINQFEIDRARAVADFYGVPLQIVDLDYRTGADRLLSELLPSLSRHQFTSLTGLNHAMLARFTRDTARGNETVFAGEMSDGAHNLGFSQYATYFHERIEFRELFDKLGGYLFSPSLLRLAERGAHAVDPVYRMFRDRAGDALFDEPSRDPVRRRRQFLASLFLRANRIPFWSNRNVAMLTDAGRATYEEQIEAPYLDEAAAALTPETAYSWYLHLYNSFHWQGSTVATLPATAEAFGLRCALPFHDGRVQRFLSVMPETCGRSLDLHPTKYPLKWMLQHRIKYPMHLQVGPHSYLYDVNPSFSHSAEILFGSSLGGYFRRMLAGGAFRDALSPEVFDFQYVDRIVGDFVAGADLRGGEMADILALSLLGLVGWGQRELQFA